MHIVQTKFRYQHGLSLIELMISLLLGALLLFGVFRIFDTNQQTARMANAFSRVQEGGRISMEMIARDIRMADHWGCTPGVSDIVNHLDTADVDYDPDLDPTVTGNGGLSGIDNVGASVTVGTVAVKQNTDMVTFRGAFNSSDVEIVSPYMTTSSATIHINAGIDIPVGEVLMISDCNAADLFANTATNTTGGVINHNTGAQTGVPENNLKNLSQTYSSTAKLLIPFTKTYFIGRPAGTTTWSLYRQDNGGAPQELVRDIDDMQILYGEDTSGNRSVDRFVEADVAAPAIDMDSVISIRITITTNSSNSAKGDVMERDYTVTGNIRNRSL